MLVCVCLMLPGCSRWRSGSQGDYHDHKVGKFGTQLYHLVFEEEIGQVKGHFGPINSLAFYPDGERWALIRV